MSRLRSASPAHLLAQPLDLACERPPLFTGALVWTIRDRGAVRVCLYQEWDEALEAAGLRE